MVGESRSEKAFQVSKQREYIINEQVANEYSIDLIRERPR